MRQDTASRPQPHRGRLTRNQREAVIAWLFILPDALGLAVFVGFPMLFSLGLGFFSVSGFGTYKFVGMANYARMFRDPLFLKSL
ncbi:MAG: sugar ABC transporter permease, partial [Verrucomicrobia bacterium]|nr:sugar ABC transporter permease [Verrucomicrobiota bacterium]